MKKRGQPTKVSPLPLSTPPRRACKTSPKPYDFDPTVLGVSASKKKAVAASPFLDPSPPPSRAPTTIADVKDLVSSHMDSLKRRLDHCHSEILKEAEASESRIAKRFKMQTQACMQVADEAEKDYKKVSERITENMEVVKTSSVGMRDDLGID
ncbi:hypothetical protein QJS10_CPA10g01322 [Acorus calamus]|uniref:Uncharacterized protein n=1 Tax=Acorus calamus TaxID=4465 RepID=A0AAV9E042_ACOCL|nr:hypothetical protein QJS10_CPA10g01322 [Acorus calamus]